MVSLEDWNEFLEAVKGKFSGEITFDWFEVNDDTLDSLDGKISALKLRKLVPIMERRISKGHFINNLRILNFSEEEIGVILQYALKLEGKFPQLIGKCRGKHIVVTPAKTEVSLFTLVKSDFEIALTIEGKFSSFKKRFDGFQDIVIDVKDFDDRFIIKGNPEEKVIDFLSYDKIRDLIRSFEPIKSLTLDEASLHVIRNVKRSEFFSRKDVETFIERFGLLAHSVENPGIIKSHEKAIPDVSDVIDDEKEKTSLEDRVLSLEKRFDKLEKTLQIILKKVENI